MIDGPARTLAPALQLRRAVRRHLDANVHRRVAFEAQRELLDSRLAAARGREHRSGHDQTHPTYLTHLTHSTVARSWAIARLVTRLKTFCDQFCTVV